MFKPKFLIIHHTAVSHQHNPDQFESVNQYHRGQYDMLSTLSYWGGYNQIMSADGIIKRYRTDGEETAAVIGHNKDSIHIALAGNFDLEQPTVNQRHALRQWIKLKMAEYDLKPEAIVAHRKFATKSCCGWNLSDKELLEMAIYEAPKENPKVIELEEIKKSAMEIFIALLKLKVAELLKALGIK